MLNLTRTTNSCCFISNFVTPTKPRLLLHLNRKIHPRNHQLLKTLVRNHHRFCVIGSGPAGFYAAQHLLKLKPDCKVDIFEKQPVPFGLVRYGVAPDHPEVKNVINTFTTVLKNPNVTFIGNFEAGKDVPLTKLKECYHSILLAYGASEDRRLDIPGEKDHVISARDFVGWYNGLPENRNLPINFQDKHRAVIIGQGNVALDIARILLSSVEVLSKTDISPYALETLDKSRIKEVVICGRRGPLQVSFTIKELRELYNLKGVKAVVSDVRDFDGINEEFLKELPRPRKRLTELMWKSALGNDSASVDSSDTTKSWFLKFLRSPLKIEKLSDKLHLTLSINQFDPNKKDRVIPTGQTELDVCDVVFRSVGYKGRRIFDDLPFNERSGVIPNVNGKVEPGIYCCGWAGQGPQGVIMTTMQNAFDVAKTVVSETDQATDQSTKPGFEGIRELLRHKRVTHYQDFVKIAEFEVKHNRKVTSIEEMFEIVNGKS